ncbi:S-layer homology domain-containing protein [Crassaminicella indica]|uniref:S-layer homology domain-containing protein n=2 Tax=Crassaminicella indica TaxID=2855394 RepID=A0ABX8REE8_9CLOT|nr:S-layer homology domain-containing protein [Crassaminicella indica]
MSMELNLNNEIEQKNFKNGFKDGYMKGYKSLTISHSSDCEIGAEHGKIFGTAIGKIYGKKDFFDNKIINWKRHCPSDIWIKNKYNLDKDTKEYAKGFIEAYKKSYMENYITSFRAMNINCKKASLEKGIVYGLEIGKINGKISGKIDYEENKINDWKNALLSDEKIIEQFCLFKEAPEYRIGFLVGYKEGFQKEYTNAFQIANINRAKENMNYTKISIEGGKIISPDETVTLFIEENTIYRPSFFNLSKRNFPLNIEKYKPLTNVYEVIIKNYSNNVNIEKPIIISFKYTGPTAGGIYQYIHNKWVYLYSIIEKDRIFTEIPAGTYCGGIYAVFLDNNYQELVDIYNHWAQKEIYTFIRRGYIKGYPDKTFKPDQHITIGEFFTLIKSIDKNNILIDEYIKDHKKHINEPISYKKAEQIMQKFTKLKTFSWDHIAEKIMYEKFACPRSYYGKNNHMTRAEAVYMLYILEKNI